MVLRLSNGHQLILRAGDIMAQSQAKDDAAAAAGTEIEAVFSQGIAYHRASMLSEAEQHYLRVLQAYPQHFDSIHLLGVIYFQRGELLKALQQIDAALRINPDVADAHNNRGNVLKRLGRLEEAMGSYGRAIVPKMPRASTIAAPCSRI
jgi:tetratricopeptide (TPR) repeat protein